jgi:RHS repeat-associated protein
MGTAVCALYDVADAIANVAQVLTFSAYGQMLAVHAVAGGTVATQAASLTSLGYSGQHFDAQAAQRYLRARFYNPATVTFNRAALFGADRATEYRAVVLQETLRPKSPQVANAVRVP